MRKGSGLAPDKRTDRSKGANDNVNVTDIPSRTEKMTRMIKIYDHRDVQPGETQSTEINWHIIILQEGGTILAGDMNAHSRRWNPKCKEQPDATFCKDIIDGYGIEIGNDGRPTHPLTRNSAEG